MLSQSQKVDVVIHAIHWRLFRLDLLKSSHRRRRLMPNWCNNYVEIKGPTQKLQALSKAAKAGEILNFMYPMPQELEQTEANGTERPELVKKTGHSDLRRMSATSSSAAVRPLIASVTKMMASASHIASSACARIIAI